MKRKHYDLILAWANGAEVQVKNPGGWVDYPDGQTPAWLDSFEYRIKPKPPVVKYGIVCNDRGSWFREDQQDHHNVKATFCPETGTLLSIEKI